MKPIAKRITLLLISTFLISAIALAQPANDNCANATLIVSDSTCVNGTSQLTGQTLSLATSDGGAIASTCTAVNSQDVWYKFVAKTQQPTITVSGLGTSWGATLKIQLLSGTCGSFTEIACANNAPVTPSLTNLLVPGTTYYIRIHKTTVTAPSGSNWGFTICVTEPLTKGSRMGEVFSRYTLSAASVLNYPWEITYGPDNNLWITESRGYKVYKMNPTTGVKTTVLDLSSGSTFLPPPLDSLDAQSMGTWNPWPQGGFAGMALHPNFLDGTGTHDFVYVAYVHRFLGGTSPSGLFYRNKLVRFKYNTGTGLLGNPVVLCDTLPGSKDHNSQRMIIAPVTPGGTPYLFYASGDMGSGQFENRTRTNNAQNVSSYEGKILRFNLDSAGLGTFIPASNPYSSNSAVYSIGIRNNQGFAYDTSTNILYGGSHGPYSDDEINIIQPFKNYGHPLVIGYADGNYNGNSIQGTITSYSAGAPWTDNNGVSSCPPVGNETTQMNNINALAATKGAYKGPLFSAYATPAATIATTWSTNPTNANWYSEAWSGLDLYSNKMIPDWNRSLVAAGLKWGRLIRLKLGTTGITTMPSNLDSANTADTVTYFQSLNRYRDLAFAPNGKDIFLIMDNTSATSGPGVGNPTVPACPGCVIKYSYLGYGDAGGLSTISKSVGVAGGPSNTCIPATTVNIDGSNNYLWVPITGPDGNIVAEINAQGQDLGTVTTSYYKNSGAIRVRGVHYLDRNITITPTITSFSTPVKVRLYISKAEFDALAADPLSGVGSILQLKVLKNSDPCGPAITNATTLLTPTNTILTDLQQGANGYVLQVNVSGFSSFYFAGSNATLPLDLITFTGSLQNNTTTLLNWKTNNEINSSHFDVERSSDGQNFSKIGTVDAIVNSTTETSYSFKDFDVTNQPSLIVFYRLKMFDKDGTYKYSNIVRISLPGTKGLITLSPNPAIDNIRANIISSGECNAEWQVIDITGRVLLKNNTSFKTGNNELIINVDKLASGSYFLKIKGACIDIKTKFQKL
jgi:glucose/arabinose dehydrogenase